MNFQTSGKKKIVWKQWRQDVFALKSQTVKNLPAMQETWVQFLGQEDALEKGMATHSSILAWSIPWTEEPGGLQSTGLQIVRHDWVTNTFFHFSNKYKPQLY